MAIDDIQFDVSDYEYLDSVPLAGWMWEFIRRSPEYNRRYQLVKELSGKARLSPTSNNFIFGKYELTKSSDDNALKKELVNLEKECFVRPLTMMGKTSVSKNFFLIYVTKMTAGLKHLSNLYIGIPNPDIRYCDFNGRKPFIRGSTSIRDYRFDHRIINIHEKEMYPEVFSRILRDSLTIENLQDTLYLGISVKANYNDVKKEIDNILWTTLKPKTHKIRKEWKYYLMTYDLYDSEVTNYRAISEKLSKLFEGTSTDPSSSDRNIGNYRKKARNLICGGYKKYLHLA